MLGNNIGFSQKNLLMKIINPIEKIKENYIISVLKLIKSLNYVLI